MCFGCTPAEAANYVQVVLTHHHPRLRKALSQHNPRMVACAHMEPPWKCRKIMHEPIGLGPVDDLYRGCDGHPCTVSKIISNIIHCKAYPDTETNKLVSKRNGRLVRSCHDNKLFGLRAQVLVAVESHDVGGRVLMPHELFIHVTATTMANDTDPYLGDKFPWSVATTVRPLTTPSGLAMPHMEVRTLEVKSTIEATQPLRRWARLGYCCVFSEIDAPDRFDTWTVTDASDRLTNLFMDVSALLMVMTDWDVFHVSLLSTDVDKHPKLVSMARLLSTKLGAKKMCLRHWRDNTASTSSPVK